jgi:poly(beta-D-mannuronate) lyase
MKAAIIILLFFLSCLAATASRTQVTSAPDINFRSWGAGDTIVMKNGIWTNQAILLKGTGTAALPVVLEAETPGEVILNGSSKIGFSGEYIVVSGLYFLDGNLSGSAVIEFRTTSSVLAENCRLTNTAIVNYNPSDKTVDSKWVSLYGKNNTVDHCSFENKTNMGTLLVVWLQSGVTVNHSITDNYFGYRNSNLDQNGDALNGQEIIRVGTSDVSMTTAAVTVSGNIFEKCNGEMEIISNKSCGNLYTNNLFIECKGTLTLRHGNNCTVAGNYFYGNGVSSTGGVRIIGENHKVYNNYFENLAGTEFRSALSMVPGAENSLLNQYFQVKNALVTFNTMINCSQSFYICGYSSGSVMPPIGSVLSHNHVFNQSSGKKNITVIPNNQKPMDVTWNNNFMNQGTYSGFSYTAAEVITGKDAKMNRAGTTTDMFEPSSTSELLVHATNEYSEVSLDVRGRTRGNSKLPGASQSDGTPTTVMPDKQNVGSFFDKTQAIAVNSEPIGNTCIIYVSGKTIISSETGTIRVFNLQGSQVLHVQNANQVLTNLPVGFYVVRFTHPSGKQTIQKIVMR